MAPKPKTKSTGKGLKKKLGPFPVYVYLLAIVAIVGFIIYRKRQGSSVVPGSENQQVIPIAIPSGGQSGRGVTTGTSSTGGTDTTPTPVDFPTDYVTQTDFQSGIDQLKDSISTSVAAITFPPPNITVTPPAVTVINQTKASKTAAKKATAPAPKKFYTYKKNVPLKPGQKIHFTKGKGYYAGD